jgi:hypothetical protein
VSIATQLSSRVQQRQAAHDKARLDALRRDCERALNDEPLSVDEADSMLARHTELGISHDEFLSLIDKLESVRNYEAALSNEAEWQLEQIALADEAAALQSELWELEQRLEYVKGRKSALPDVIRGRFLNRQNLRDELAALKAGCPELFASQE